MISFKKNITLVSCLLLILAINVTASADGLRSLMDISETTQPFPDKSLDQWQEKSFLGNTRYELVEDNGLNVLKAVANNTASVLYRKQTIDLTRTPWLEWSWKIESTYDNIDEQTKAGDDFPARVYVTAKTGSMPWQTIAINYVWSSNTPKNSVWANPYTNKSIMVSVQSGDRLVGQWIDQRRNIAHDFKQLFEIDVDQLAGYAVMVDGDNSSQSGTAYFGNIAFVAK